MVIVLWCTEKKVYRDWSVVKRREWVHFKISNWAQQRLGATTTTRINKTLGNPLKAEKSSTIFRDIELNAFLWNKELFDHIYLSSSVDRISKKNKNNTSLVWIQRATFYINHINQKVNAQVWCFRQLSASYFYSNDWHFIASVQNTGWSFFLKENHKISGSSCQCPGKELRTDKNL